MNKLVTLIAAALVAVLLAPASAQASADPLAAWHTAYATAGTAQANVVWLGSSTTYGVGASSPDKRYTDLVTAQLRGAPEPVTRVADSYPTRNTSPGVHGYVSAPGGSTSENYISDVNRPWILWERPSLIVHMVGSNDSVTYEPFAVPVDEYEANIGDKIDRLDASISRPMSHLLVHTYRRPDVTAATWRTYGDALDRVAAARDNVAVVDVSQEYESADHHGEDPRNLIHDADGLHPSDAGHALMARLIADALLGETSSEPTPEPEPTTTPTPSPTPSPTPAPTPQPTTPPAAEPTSVPATTSTSAPAAPLVLAAPSSPRRVRAIRDGRKVRVTWRSAAGAEQYAARCGRRTAVARTTKAVVHGIATSCRVRAMGPGGVSPWVGVRIRS